MTDKIDIYFFGDEKTYVKKEAESFSSTDRWKKEAFVDGFVSAKKFFGQKYRAENLELHQIRVHQFNLIEKHREKINDLEKQIETLKEKT